MLVFAIDFDGTLCTDKYPEIGTPNDAAISFFKDAKKAGEKLILWTCRSGNELAAAVEWCKTYGLEFDAINDNLPDNISQYGGNSRKINADIYVDDRAHNLQDIARICQKVLSTKN